VPGTIRATASLVVSPQPATLLWNSAVFGGDGIEVELAGLDEGTGRLTVEVDRVRGDLVRDILP
jgi:hypothetical protein